MTKEEIKKMVEDMVQDHCEEYDLTEDEVRSPVFCGLLDKYVNGELTKEELLEAVTHIKTAVVEENLDLYKKLRLEEKAKRNKGGKK